jgi:hypothetical protein
MITKAERRVYIWSLTYLDELIPASGDDDGVLGVGRESHAGDPLGVALVGDGVLAVTEGVPELDGSVARSGNDLAVVGGEGDGENVVGVADEAAGGDTGGELPQAEGLVPGGGESVSTVGGDDLFQNCQLSDSCVLACQLFRVANCGLYVRSRTQCGSGRADSSWGSRTMSRRGSGSR